ncbi:MAG: Gfo/Idh/MocA family protein [Chloroflexota bacterium]
MSANEGRRLTVAVLGTGRMAAVHVAALANLRERGLAVDGSSVGVEPALFGRDAAKVAALASQYGVRRTSTVLDELIDDPSVDVIDNCLVNSLHFGPLTRAIERGKHVFTEKPLTMELGEAEKLLAAARAAGVRHGLIQNMRFNPGPLRAKELIDQGVVGRVFSARIVFGYMVPQTVTNRPTWFYKKVQAGGGVVEDMMAHFFDLLRHLVGPVDRVYAATGTAWPERREPDGTPFPADVEDLAAVTVKFANGAVGDCFASWVRRKHEEVPFFEIDGEDGSLIFSFNRLRVQTRAETPLFRYDARKVQTESEADWRSVDLDLKDPFELQLEDFLKGVASGRPTRPDWEDAVANQRLIAAAYRSVREGREVALAEIAEEAAGRG